MMRNDSITIESGNVFLHVIISQAKREGLHYHILLMCQER